MLDFSQMLTRFALALALGALVGLEREIAGKEAGIRTTMLVSGSAALFTIAGVMFPFLIDPSSQTLNPLFAGAGAVIISNIVLGAAFLGGGIIIKTAEHVHGFTTAAIVWMTAAIGTLAGLGLFEFATAVAIISTGMLFVLRKMGLYELIHPKGKSSRTNKTV